MAAVRVVLPWSMWPIVPMLRCGLVRWNFSFGMCCPFLLLSSNPRHDLLGDLGGYLLVRVELHRRVRGPPLRARAKVRGVAEQLGQRDQHADGPHAGALVDLLDPAAPRRDVAQHVPHEPL